jgi:tetratricopeptide (TPR) repeat protein
MPRATINPVIIRPPADLVQRYPDIVSLAKQLSLQYVHRKVVPEENLKAMGQALWQVLNIDKDFTKVKRKAGLYILPIVIESTAPGVFALPWECLYHPEEGFLGKHPCYTLSRRWQSGDALLSSRHFLSKVGNDKSVWQTLEVFNSDLPKGPLRVLLFTSQPDNIEPEKMRLDIESEQAYILESLDEFISKGQVVLTAPDDGRFSTLRQLLRSETFHLVFLSGHGKFAAETFSKAPDQAYFLFEGEHGLGHSVAAPKIAEAFVGTSVQCVVLSACQSGKTSSDELNAGLVSCLARAGVPHVVGMRESILDRAGILFAQAFCQALAKQERLDVAIQAGRVAITQPLPAPCHNTAANELAEVSLGQWCLPMLVSHDPNQGLIDWAFTAKPPTPRPLLVDSLADIALPTVFIGRRKELRELGQALSQRAVRHLLITGPGGQGKTALAGQLARKLEKQGYLVYVYSARPQDSAWEKFVFLLKSRLDEQLLEQVERRWGRCTHEMQRAQLLLKALLQHSGARLVLFFDNLESVQNPRTGALTDATLEAWLTAALYLDKLLILLTSRWALPGSLAVLKTLKVHILARPSYGDFLRYTQQIGLHRKRQQLRQLYEALGGNFKGLQLFHSAQHVGIDEAAFLERVRTAQAELQAYLAVAQVVSYLNTAEKRVLYRLPAYTTPVTQIGVEKIAQDLPAPAALLERLVALSLVDVEKAPDLNNQLAYQLSPLVAEWLQTQGVEAPSIELRKTAAFHQKWVFEQLRKTVSQAITVHEALQAAGLQKEAECFALAVLLPHFDKCGMYQTLLGKWLPPLRESVDKSLQIKALDWSGKTCLNIGDYEAALGYYQQARKLNNELGDRQNDGQFLNSIGLIYKIQGDFEAALDYYQQALKIRDEIDDHQGKSTTLNNIAVIYYTLGDYDKALDCFQAVLKNDQLLGDRQGESVTLNNIGMIYKIQGEYEIALGYYQQVLKICREISDRRGESVTLNNIGRIYRAYGDDDTALEYSQQDLSICREMGDQAGLCGSLFNIGHIYWDKGEKQQALAHWVTAYEIAKQIGYAQALSALVELATQLGGEGLAFWDSLSGTSI